LVRRTLALSCEAVPAVLRRRGHEAALRPRDGAAESFVSFNALLGSPEFSSERRDLGPALENGRLGGHRTLKILASLNGLPEVVELKGCQHHCFGKLWVTLKGEKVELKRLRRAITLPENVAQAQGSIRIIGTEPHRLAKVALSLLILAEFSECDTEVTVGVEVRRIQCESATMATDRVAPIARLAQGGAKIAVSLGE
jgi:hypothetical protein